MRIPCKTISLISDNVQLIENLPTEILETVVTSKRILSCIPASSLERLVAQSKGLSKMSLYTLMKSATILPREKYTLKLIQAIILKQVTIFCLKKKNRAIFFVICPDSEDCRKSFQRRVEFLEVEKCFKF